MHPHIDTESTLILRALARLEERISKIAPQTPQLLTIDQAAEYLAMSADTVRRLCDRRQLQYVQTSRGGAKRIPLESLRSWIESHSTAPIAQ